MECADLLKEYGITLKDSPTPISSSTGNVFLISTDSDINYYFKLKQNKNQIILEYNLSQFLNLEKISSPSPIKTKYGELYVENNQNLYCLYNEIITSSSIFIDDLKSQIYLGEKIAHLHRSLKLFDLKNVVIEEMNLLCQVSNIAFPYIKLRNNSIAYFLESEVLPEIQSLNCESFLKATLQLIHGDLHFGNIIYQNEKICGFYDFENASICNKMVDVCYFLLSTLRMFKMDENNWLVFVHNVVKSYSREIELTKFEVDNIKNIMLAIEILNIAYLIQTNNTKEVKNVIFEIHFLLSIKNIYIENERC